MITSNTQNQNPNHKMNTKRIVSLIISGVVPLLAALVFWIGWVNFIDNYELGFSYDKFSGRVEVLPRTGYFIRNPFHYSLHGLDLRPYQVSISANSRILNAKLVRFNPTGLSTFLAWHGRKAGNNLANLQEILKCYAFDREEGRDCPFLTVVSVLAPNQGGAIEK